MPEILTLETEWWWWW